MDITLQYILVGVVLFFITQLMLLLIKLIFHSIKNKILEIRENRKKWKYSKIDEDNILLKDITQTRFIIIKGSWGKGKTILMNIIAYFLYKRNFKYYSKNHRYYNFCKKDFLNSLKDLEEKKLLPVYANLDFIDIESDKKSHDLEPYIKLQKKAVENAVFCIDEFSSIFPKELYYQNVKGDNKELEEQIQLFKKFRHYTNGWILGTEQNGTNIFVRFRDNEYALINALGTTVKLSKWGKFKRLILNSINIFMPALFTVNVRLERQKVLFKEDLFKFYLKLLLPAYFSFPVNFYERKQKINNYIKQKHQIYITKFEYNGKQYFFKYTNKEKFSYNTRAFKNEYDEKFDSNGNRKDNKRTIEAT